MTALQWIVKEAKTLKKKYPKRFSTWREYVAQASAIYASKHKGKSPVGKKKSSKVGAVKKSVKKTSKKAVKSYHKDTKSHNVNIHVASGIGKHWNDYKVYKGIVIDIEKTPSGKKWYSVTVKPYTAPFYNTSLPIVKKFIDRELKLKGK